jgi:hypothetical protein
MTRLSALNVLPLKRGGSGPWEALPLASGQLLGGPYVDAFSAIYNLDVRRGAAYGDQRNADPLTYNIMRIGGGVLTGDPSKWAEINADPTTGDPRYRVSSPAMALTRALRPFIPGSAGALSYAPIAALAQSPVSGIETVTDPNAPGNAWLQYAPGPSQKARGWQRGFSELTGLPLRPEQTQQALKYYLQRQQR